MKGKLYFCGFLSFVFQVVNIQFSILSRSSFQFFYFLYSFLELVFKKFWKLNKRKLNWKTLFWHYRPTNYYRALTTWKDYAWVHLYKVDLVNDDDNNTKEISFSYFFLTKCFYFHGVVFMNKTLAIYWQEGTKRIKQDAFSFANLFWISHNYVTFKSIQSIEIA